MYGAWLTTGLHAYAYGPQRHEVLIVCHTPAKHAGVLLRQAIVSRPPDGGGGGAGKQALCSTRISFVYMGMHGMPRCPAPAPHAPLMLRAPSRAPFRRARRWASLVIEATPLRRANLDAAWAQSRGVLYKLLSTGLTILFFALGVKMFLFFVRLYYKMFQFGWSVLSSVLRLLTGGGWPAQAQAAGAGPRGQPRRGR